MPRCREPVHLTSKLGLLKLGIGRHPLILIATGQVESREAQIVETGKGDKFVTVAIAAISSWNIFIRAASMCFAQLKEGEQLQASI